jgi:hypothetical protein
MRKAIVALVIVAGLAAGADLIENGRFELPRISMAFASDELGRPVPEARCDLVALRF